MYELARKHQKATGSRDAVNRFLAAIPALLSYAFERRDLHVKPRMPKRQELEKRLLFGSQAQALKLLANLPRSLQ
jgi:hypothetical protein